MTALPFPRHKSHRALIRACLADKARGDPRLQSLLYRKKAPHRVITTECLMESGDVLLSRAVASQVPSALRGLTSVFGMGTGGSLLL